tara:strand:- start:1684 stop:1836 length:153 start_codon:yes stop_codon:yes gene_type:complete
MIFSQDFNLIYLNNVFETKKKNQKFQSSDFVEKIIERGYWLKFTTQKKFI